MPSAFQLHILNPFSLISIVYQTPFLYHQQTKGYIGITLFVSSSVHISCMRNSTQIVELIMIKHFTVVGYKLQPENVNKGR